MFAVDWSELGVIRGIEADIEIDTSHVVRQRPYTVPQATVGCSYCSRIYSWVDRAALQQHEHLQSRTLVLALGINIPLLLV